MLVRRHRLRGELPAEQVTGLGEHDVDAAGRGGEPGGHAAQPAADDQQRRLSLPAQKVSSAFWMSDCACFIASSADVWPLIAALTFL